MTKKTNDIRIIEAHKFCTNNREALSNDRKCGCFHCLSIFHPCEVKKWIRDTSGTALCPYCGIDSVIGESSGYPVTKEFLTEMREYWFSPVPQLSLGLPRGTVKLLPHQRVWDYAAAAAIAQLREVLGGAAVDIQHVGSTSIRSIAAKPIIDIAVGMASADDVLPYVDALAARGFTYRKQDVAGQQLLVMGAGEMRTHHIHVVEHGGEAWENYLNFRDYLNRFPAKAAEYEACKRTLAAQFADDRGSYTAGKEELITRLLGEARAWRGILREERDFPALFAEREAREWGVMYHMPGNPDSYDGNHACIEPEKITDLGAVLDEIVSFYAGRGVRASVYHPFVPGYFAENAKILAARGWRFVPEKAHRVMLLTAENALPRQRRLDIRLSDGWDGRIASDILIPAGEPWEIEVTRRRAENGALLFVGYLDGRAVTYTDIHVSPHGNTRFDYIVTAPDARRQGFGGELISFVTDWCREQNLPQCWQWAGPSEKLCHTAGFREAFTMEGGYALAPEIG